MLMNYVPLLSIEGHILCLLLDKQDLTVTEAAALTKTSERTATRSMTNLVKAGLVRRTKVGRHHHYQIVKGMVKRNPDSALMHCLYRYLFEDEQSLGAAITQFVRMQDNNLSPLTRHRVKGYLP